MKKFRLIIFILSVFLKLNSNAQKIDTITSFSYDTSLHNFINNSQQIFTYNGACYVIKYNYILWDSTKNKYVNYYRTTNSLLANNATSQTLSQLWDDAASKWDNYQKGIYTYTTSSTFPSTILYQNYNGSSWVNSRLYTYSYDANWNDTSILIQDWNTTSSTWKNSYLYKYVYNTGNVITHFKQYMWDNAAWKNSYQTIYFINGTNKPVIDSGLKWSDISSNWINNYKNVYTYDANNFLTGYINNIWDTVPKAFIPYQQYIYTNNAAGFAIDVLTLNYNGSSFDTFYLDHNSYNNCVLPLDEIIITANKDLSSGTNIVKWVASNIVNAKYFVVETSYDARNFSELKVFNINSQANSFSYIHPSVNQTIYYKIKEVFTDGRIIYSKTVKVNKKVDDQIVSVYPNPANSKIIVKPNSSIKNGFITLYNIYGVPVITQPLNTNGNLLNIFGFAKGSYIIKVYNQFVEYINRVSID